MALVPKGNAEDVALAALLAFTPSFAEDQDAITAEIAAVYLAAYRASGASVTGAVEAQAQAFASARAAVLVEDLAQTTEDDVADFVATARRGAWDLERIRGGLGAAFTFSAARALSIAITETTLAWTQGGRAAALDGGRDEKSSQTNSDNPCEDCIANEDTGWISIDEAYPSGEDGPPFHVNCACGEVYRRVEEKTAQSRVVADARCPQCNRWIGQNILVGGQGYCPTHKGVTVLS
jgi:hypothetical protein